MTGYWIEKKERNTILWVRENKLPCLECHYKVSSLIEGLEYQFRVYAMNIAGLSKASEASRPVVALNPVGKETFSTSTNDALFFITLISNLLQVLMKLCDSTCAAALINISCSCRSSWEA